MDKKDNKIIEKKFREICDIVFKERSREIREVVLLGIPSSKKKDFNGVKKDFFRITGFSLKRKNETGTKKAKKSN